MLWTGTTWYVLGRAVPAECQGFLVSTPSSSEQPRGVGKGKWLVGCICCQSDVSSHVQHLPIAGGMPRPGLEGTGAPLPGGAVVGPEVVKAARARSPAEPQASLPAASCRQPLTGSCR